MTRPSLDRIDLRILHALMRDATIPVARLADRVNLSQTPCWKRVRKLEEAGVIRGRVALVDPEALGIGLMAFVEIAAIEHSPAWRDDLARVVEEFPEVLEAHRMAGDIDYLLKVAVADMPAFDAFYARLTEALPCRQVTSRFSLERVKETTAWPLGITVPTP